MRIPKTVRLLIFFLIFSAVAPQIDYSALNYYGEAESAGFFLVYIVFAALFLGLLVGSTLPKSSFRVLKKNTLLDVFLFWIPFVISILLVIIAVAYYDFSRPLDSQPYKEIIGSIRGKVLIHLLPAGVVYRSLLGKLSKKLLILVVVAVISYTIFYTERLFIVPFLFILLLYGFRVNRLSVGKLTALIAAGFAIFVVGELTRSYLFVRLTNVDFTLWDALEYGALRLPLYYADTFLKSATCVEVTQFVDGKCPLSFWETPLLTNRGTISELMPITGYFMVVVIAFFLGVLASYAIGSFEDKKMSWTSIIAPYAATAVLEFPRFGYILVFRFWGVFLALFVIALIANLVRKPAPL